MEEKNDLNNLREQVENDRARKANIDVFVILAILAILAIPMFIGLIASFWGEEIYRCIIVSGILLFFIYLLVVAFPSILLPEGSWLHKFFLWGVKKTPSQTKKRMIPTAKKLLQEKAEKLEKLPEIKEESLKLLLETLAQIDALYVQKTEKLQEEIQEIKDFLGN
ncbi:MAG: hypothetical protein LBU27_09835 [Candidatus Peribacteria bacterium]|jgi:hypothetical protein|nr:hypothetical protein [Candidatus Peribacteria bacterium]